MGAEGKAWWSNHGWRMGGRIGFRKWGSIGLFDGWSTSAFLLPGEHLARFFFKLKIAVLRTFRSVGQCYFQSNFEHIKNRIRYGFVVGMCLWKSLTKKLRWLIFWRWRPVVCGGNVISFVN